MADAGATAVREATGVEVVAGMVAVADGAGTAAVRATATERLRLHGKNRRLVGVGLRRKPKDSMRKIRPYRLLWPAFAFLVAERVPAFSPVVCARLIAAISGSRVKTKPPLVP